MDNLPSGLLPPGSTNPNGIGWNCRLCHQAGNFDFQPKQRALDLGYWLQYRVMPALAKAHHDASPFCQADKVDLILPPSMLEAGATGDDLRRWHDEASKPKPPKKEGQ